MTKHYLLAITVLCCSSSALALDASELASLTATVQAICVTPDRMGDYLQTEGEVKVGAPVLVKIITGELSGKLTYEKWRGISIAADKYKTDPRQCAIEILKILQPELHSARQGNVNQSTDGPCSPAIANVGGNVTVKGECK
jgi:hypothetical protein